jgi:hypothetical protein
MRRTCVQSDLKNKELEVDREEGKGEESDLITDDKHAASVASTSCRRQLAVPSSIAIRPVTAAARTSRSAWLARCFPSGPMGSGFFSGPSNRGKDQKGPAFRTGVA